MVKNKINIIVFILLIFFVINFVSSYEYECRFKDVSSCIGSWNNIVVRVSSPTNAHGELYNSPGNPGPYQYAICCNWSDPSFPDQRDYSDPNINETHILFNLSHQTNAHASVKYGEYFFPYPIIYAPMQCEAISTSCNSEYYMGIASMSDITTGENAHLGNISAYPYKICCKHPSEPQPPPTCEAPNNICTSPQVCYSGEEVVASGLGPGEVCCSGACCTQDDCSGIGFDCGVQTDNCGYSVNCGDCSIGWPAGYECNLLGKCVDSINCVLDWTNWSTNFAWQGDDVFLYVWGSTGCYGKSVDLTVYQSKIGSDPPVDDPELGGIQPSPAVFDSNGLANGTWEAEYHSTLSGLPKYYFYADYLGFSIKSSDPKLEVNTTNCAGIMTCGDYHTPEECAANICSGTVLPNHESQAGITCGEQECITEDSWFDCGCLWDDGECKFAYTEFGCGEDPINCGDGVIQNGEECDGNEFLGLNCTDFGFVGGTLTCQNCRIQYEMCEGFYCDNDGIIDFGNETCDGVGTSANFTNSSGGVWTCFNFDDYDQGSLSCDNCEIDTSDCSRSSINQIFNFGKCFKNQDDIIECDDDPVGFYISYWDGLWEWGHQGYQLEIDCETEYGIPGDGSCELDNRDNLHYYDPTHSRKDTCSAGGESVIECPAEIRLGFFNYYNLVVTFLLIGLVYLFGILKIREYKKVL